MSDEALTIRRMNIKFWNLRGLATVGYVVSVIDGAWVWIGERLGGLDFTCEGTIETDSDGPIDGICDIDMEGIDVRTSDGNADFVWLGVLVGANVTIGREIFDGLLVLDCDGPTVGDTVAVGLEVGWIFVLGMLVAVGLEVGSTVTLGILVAVGLEVGWIFVLGILVAVGLEVGSTVTLGILVAVGLEVGSTVTLGILVAVGLEVGSTMTLGILVFEEGDWLGLSDDFNTSMMLSSIWEQKMNK